MKPQLLLAAIAFLALPFSGCFGLPEGAADTGDSVSIRYTVTDEAGTVLRLNRTATFVLGSGESGLGLAVERAVRGHVANETFTVHLGADDGFGFTGEAAVGRHLPAIPRLQNASRAEFDASQFGPAELGKTFDAYGIYLGTVTALNATTVEYKVDAVDGQRDTFTSIGCVLVSNVVGDEIRRTLEPMTGATFAIQPPSIYQRTTPLGLAPGSYRVLGATADEIQYAYAESTAVELIGKELSFQVTVLRIVPGTSTVAPSGDDYGMRDSPQVNGDPYSALDQPGAADDDHAH